MISTRIAFAAVTAGIVAWGTALAQDGTIYPANADKVSYAELDKLPDFRGLWFPNLGRTTGDEPQLIGEAKAKWDTYQARLKADPHYEIPETPNNCEPDGMPYFMNFPYSVEFLFTPGKITVVQEALMQIRRIFTDGRPLAPRKELEPNYFGYSRGHWEGDTLVVTTIGTKAGQRLGVAGISNSDELTITERIYLDPENKDMLHLDFTYDDPKVLAQPWHQNHTFRRDRTWEQLEYVCAQNNKHMLDADGQTLVPEDIRK